MLRVYDQVPIDRKRAKHLAALCETIFLHTRHLHGLTKTSLGLLRAAALLHGSGAHGKQFAHNGAASILRAADPPLSASQRWIVVQALGLDACHGDRCAQAACAPVSKKDAMLGVAARIAAILQIADGLDELREQDTEITAVCDDGDAIHIYLAGGPGAQQNAAAALAKAELWNQVALRPVRSIAVGPQPCSRSALVEPSDTVAEAGRRILQQHLEQLISRQYGLAYAEDVEYVHEMRVATRRLRAAMRILRKAVAGSFRQEIDGLRQLAEVLGAARDSDVFLQFLQGYAKRSPKGPRWFLKKLMRSQQRQRGQHYRRTLELCRSPQCQQFLRGLYQTLRCPVGSEGGIAATEKGVCRPVFKGARQALRCGFRRLKRFGRRVDQLSPGRQHRLRIACKKLRYAAESFAEVYPPELEKLITTMVQMQDLLGKGHDADLYNERLRQYFDKRYRKRSDSKATAALQAMRSHLGRWKRQCLAKAGAIWKSFTTNRVQQELRELIESPRTA